MGRSLVLSPVKAASELFDQRADHCPATQILLLHVVLKHYRKLLLIPQSSHNDVHDSLRYRIGRGMQSKVCVVAGFTSYPAPLHNFRLGLSRQSVFSFEPFSLRREKSGDHAQNLVAGFVGQTFLKAAHGPFPKRLVR